MKLLENETRIMAKATGFSQHALVMFILAGIKPWFSRVSITTPEHYLKLPDHQPLFRKEVVLHIRAKDFSFEELRRVYRKVRNGLSFGKYTSKSERKLETYLMVYKLSQELGKPPARGSQGHYKYWKCFVEKWRKRCPGEKPQTWQGLRYAYEWTQKLTSSAGR